MAPDCAAKFLIEKLVPDAEDPDYMERVIKSVVGTMYLGGSQARHGTSTVLLIATAI